MNNPLFDYESESYSDLYQEFVNLRERVETTNNKLQSQINDITNKAKRVYQKKELSPETQAIHMHYQEHKGNEEVISSIQTNMMTIGYTLYPISKMPKLLLHMECLKRFNALTKDEKQKYFDRK